MGDVQGGGRGLGDVGTRSVTATPSKAVTPGEAAGIIFVLVTMVVAWGASAVVLRLLLHTTWAVSVAVAPLAIIVPLIVRNALRHRRGLRPQRSS